MISTQSRVQTQALLENLALINYHFYNYIILLSFSSYLNLDS